MNILTEILAIFGVLVILLFILIRFLGITKLQFATKILGLSYEAPQKSDLNISVGNYIGLVVSLDGETRKLHLRTVLQTSKNQLLENFSLVLDRSTQFRAKQFYSQDNETTQRFPNSKISLPFNLPVGTQDFSIEFETVDYQPFNLTKGRHQVSLYYSVNNKKRKNTFEINFVNIRSLELAVASMKKPKLVVVSERTNNVIVIEVPILLPV